MTLIASQASLLHAVQDLHAGKTDAVERLPAIAAQAHDAELAALLGDEAGRAERQAARLTAAGINPSGPANLWMAGILNDAERDGRSTDPGALLDVALIGAIRKAKAAEIVSSDTALALARATGDDTLAAVVAANQAEEVATDRRLRAALDRLTGG
jgi:ferritin-like metal-binding protein YciE